MAAQKESVRDRIAVQLGCNLFSEGRNVLIVREDRNPFAMLVSFHSLEAFEHFIAGDGQAAFPCVAFRKQSAPGGVRVEDATDVARANYSEMQKCFGRRL